MSTARHDLVGVTEHESLLRLLELAKGRTHQGRRVADFLLAWWNAGSCGGFDITSGWALDEEVVADVTIVFALALHVSEYPDALGYGAEFEQVEQAWRPKPKA